MARISIQYTRYANSRLATVLSFIGGTLCSLCILPGVLLFAVSVMQLVMGGFVKAEAWSGMGTAVVLLAIGIGLSILLKLAFEKLASMAASRGRR